MPVGLAKELKLNSSESGGGSGGHGSGGIVGIGNLAGMQTGSIGS